MASMAASIAAARVSALAGGNRVLDEKERSRYFASLSSMARRITRDKERIRQRYGAQWEKLGPREQEEAIDRGLVAPELRGRYALHQAVCPPASPACPPGHKLVHHGEEDITWQDEHSAPFSWETRSQMEFSIASLSDPELPSGTAQPEDQQTTTPAAQSSQMKSPLGNAQVKGQGTRMTQCEGATPTRKEEESAFWKISMERSRIEGSQAEFQSLTPSQIKSLEKGEKPVPVCYKQDSSQREKELLLPEKSVLITKPLQKMTNPSIVSLDNPRPSLCSISALGDAFSSDPRSPVDPKPYSIPSEPRPPGEPRPYGFPSEPRPPGEPRPYGFPSEPRPPVEPKPYGFSSEPRSPVEPKPYGFPSEPRRPVEPKSCDFPSGPRSSVEPKPYGFSSEPRSPVEPKLEIFPSELRRPVEPKPYGFPSEPRRPVGPKLESFSSEPRRAVEPKLESFSSEPRRPVGPKLETDKENDCDEVSAGAQLFSQINTSSSLLKTGFDFLDNW